MSRKQVILMRHGKRGHKGGLLTLGGVKEVEKTADEMIAAGIRPDVIYSSLSPRALQSAEILVKQFQLAGIEVSLREDNRLEFGPIPEVLAELDENIRTAIMVGHQDALRWAAEGLTLGSFFPHSGQAAVIECREGSWGSVSKSRLNKLGRKFGPNPG